MAHRKLTIEVACPECGATGLYVGIAEKDGAAVVCRRCKGTGKATLVIEYGEFEGRKTRLGVIRVYQCNPGIVIGRADGKYTLADFGGMPVDEWLEGKPFPPGSEARRLTCPAWWYQTANYKLKPDWRECEPCMTFSGCRHFPNKDHCWRRWDEENGQVFTE